MQGSTPNMAPRMASGDVVFNSIPYIKPASIWHPSNLLLPKAEETGNPALAIYIREKEPAYNFRFLHILHPVEKNVTRR